MGYFRTGGKRGYRGACIFLLMALGMFLFSACGSDSAEDLVRDVVDIDFDENATINLNELITGKASGSNPENDCNMTSVAAELEKLEDEIDNLEDVDIDDVELNNVRASYRATWVPAEVTTLTCTLTLTGTRSTELEAHAINRSSGNMTFSLTPEQIEVINYYLSNRGEQFTYCLECDNFDAIDTFNVTYQVEFDVTITGNI